MIRNILMFAVLAVSNGFMAGMAVAEDMASTAATPAASAQPTVSYQAPYPFTADQFLDKLLQLADQPGGFITKDKVESIFGVTLNRDEDYYRQYHETIYALIREKNWYFNMSIGNNVPANSFFYFNWGNAPGQKVVDFPPPPDGMCIDASKLGPELKKRDWFVKQEGREINNPPFTDVYRKFKMGKMTVYFSPDSNCLLGLRIATSPSVLKDMPLM